jgi:integrase/recombinase XerD
MPTLVEAIDTYLKVDRAPTTNRQYARVLNLMADAVGKKRPLKRIAYEDLLDYVNELKGDVKSSTAATYLATLKAFFAWCVKRGYISESPAEDIRVRVEIGERDVEAVPPAELERMINFTKYTSRRNYALLMFLADTACRVGGAVSLTLENLDLDNRAALILEKRNKWVYVYFGIETEMALRAWLAVRPVVEHSSVWTSSKKFKNAPLKTWGIFEVVKTVSRQAGASREWHPHAIRHSVGHAMAKAGLPASAVQMKLNHEDAATTIKHYFPRNEAYMRQISDEYALIAIHPPQSKKRPLRLLPRRKAQ